MNAYSISWGSFIQRNGNDVTIQWGWQNEDSNSIICYNPSGCIVTVGPYDYRGSSADSKTFGGINLPYGMQQKSSSAIMGQQLMLLMLGGYNMERLIHKLLLQCGEIIQIQISLQFVMDSKFFKYQPGDILWHFIT